MYSCNLFGLKKKFMQKKTAICELKLFQNELAMRRDWNESLNKITQKDTLLHDALKLNINGWSTNNKRWSIVNFYAALVSIPIMTNAISFQFSVLLSTSTVFYSVFIFILFHFNHHHNCRLNTNAFEAMQKYICQLSNETFALRKSLYFIYVSDLIA